MRRFVVVCTRRGCLPQVVGPFSSEAECADWIRDNWRELPEWALSIAELQLAPNLPVEWPQHYLREVGVL